MRSLRFICVFALVALLVLGSVGTVFAKGQPADVPKGPKFQGEKQGFCGNVTVVVDGNVTIITDKGNVTVTLTDDTRYKITKVMNKWGSYDEFVSKLGGNITALEGMKVVVLAGNVTGTDPGGPFTGVALKFMALSRPATPLYAHRTGVVTAKPEGNATTGNITIIDVHGAFHTFAITSDTYYRPMGMGLGNITADANEPYDSGTFVTVVTTGDPKVAPVLPAKAIVLHASRPEVWPKPLP
jgi:hypothetical protein